MDNSLIEKYNVPAPRYTSYPTVPFWQTEAPSQEEWISNVQAVFDENQEISLYIHLPFCENLCTYCGCNKRITKNHQVELPYLNAVLKEWNLYLDILPEQPIIKEIHLGGGTPTFFSPENLDYLLSNIFKTASISDDYEFSFEAHPSSTTFEHLSVLRKLGFKRISIGVQDFDEKILKVINRRQTLEEVENVVKWARELKYDSINFDLIFGLPFQTKAHIQSSFEKVSAMLPDRIAFYSYAHVPWKSASQRAYSEKDLPIGKEKQALYELGRTLLENAGYHEIGLDHFGLASDQLYKAQKEGKLHRNFMGYTTNNTKLCIALGASSISDSWTAFVQNEKKIETYKMRVQIEEFPIIRGHLLHKEDQILRKHILNLMCNHETEWKEKEDQCEALFEGIERLEEIVQDGLVELGTNKLSVTEIGKPFIRNICLALDNKYWEKRSEEVMFSQVV